MHSARVYQHMLENGPSETYYVIKLTPDYTRTSSMISNAPQGGPRTHRS